MHSEVKKAILKGKLSLSLDSEKNEGKKIVLKVIFHICIPRWTIQIGFLPSLQKSWVQSLFCFFKKVQIKGGRKFFFIGKVKTIYICRHKVDLVEGHIKKTVIKSVKIVHKVREITFKMDD